MPNWGPTPPRDRHAALVVVDGAYVQFIAVQQ